METPDAHIEVENGQRADAQLVATALAEQQAFAELVNRYYSRIYAAAYAYTGQREPAEEVAQEAFLRAYLHLDKLQNSAAFGPWVVKIARNLACNWREQVQVRARLANMVPVDEELAEIADSSSPSPRDHAVAAEQKELIQSALQRLAPPDRELVLLHYMEDVSQSDLARQLNVYPSTVSRRLEKALSVLREELGRRFTSVGPVLKPSQSGARRTLVLVSVAANLPATSKAGLASLAAAVQPASVAPAPAATNSIIPGNAKPGGTLMAVTKAVVAGLAGLCLLKVFYPESSAAEPVDSAAVVHSAVRIPTAEVATRRVPIASPPRIVASAAPAAPSLSSSIRPSMPYWQLASVEAERCKITSPDYRIEPEDFASSREHLGFWGDLGDGIEWQVSVPEVLTNARIGVRYAYDATDYMRKTNSPAGDHVAHLYINNNGPIILKFPDTRGWNWYQVAVAELPFLDAGTHSFRIVAPLDYQAVNVDAITLFRGDLEAAPPGPLQPTVVSASEDSKVMVLASPNAQLVEKATDVNAVFHQLVSLMEVDFGRNLENPVYVHFVEPACWDYRNGRAIKNRHGIYLLADQESERAEWCWVLAEYMADPQVPRWFRQSLCRTNGLLDWLPSLDKSTTSEEDVLAAELVAEADAFLADPATTCSRVEVVHAAVREKYGADVFRKFWQELAKGHEPESAAPDTQRTRTLEAVDLLDKHLLVETLSKVAGENVAPFYQRWVGFATELPLDPVVVDERAGL